MAKSRLEHYLEHEHIYVFVMLAAFLAVETTINASSLLMEAVSEGDNTPGWNGFALEYTSGIAMLCLFPLILAFEKRFPISWPLTAKTLGGHLLGSLSFSVLHIALMTLLRKLIYSMLGGGYTLGDPSWALLYEYRKDAWTYAGFLTAIYVYRFIMSRLRGEARLVAEGENSPPENIPERLLVKKLGKEFIVRVDEIEWLESAGNYVNLHVGNRIYPLRSTLSALIGQLEPGGFRRTHRSHGVNLEFVASIAPLDTGDAEIVLNSGHKLPLSRRYRDSFRSQLGAG
jgi:hypothetical protein